MGNSNPDTTILRQPQSFSPQWLHAAWFAVFTKPQHEKKVAEHFRSRSLEVFLPTYEEKHSWKNRQTIVLNIPLFPGYLFAHIFPQQRRLALAIPGVISILGGSPLSCAVTDQYIETLRTGLALGRILPHPPTAIGDRVRIISGPMAGVSGILAHVRSEFRVVLSIAMIRQCVSIEVSRDEIEAESAIGSAPGFGLRAESL